MSAEKHIQEHKILGVTKSPAAANTMIVIGDSIPSKITPDTPPYKITSCNMFHEAIYRLGGRLKFQADLAVGGKTSTQVLAEQVYQAINHADGRPGYIGMHCGTNDLGTENPSTLKNFKQIADICKDEGVRLIASNILPRYYTGGGNGHGSQARLYNWAQANDYLQSRAAVDSNMILVDGFSKFLDASSIANAAKGEPITAYMEYLTNPADSTHPSQAGHNVLADAIYDALNPLLPTVPHAAGVAWDGIYGNQQSVLPNMYLLAGTGGTPGTGVTGPVAQGWTVQRSIGAVTCTASLVARAAGIPGNWQQVVFSGGTAETHGVELTYEMPPYEWANYGFVNGDQFYLECEIEATASVGTISEVHARAGIYDVSYNGLSVVIGHSQGAFLYGRTASVGKITTPVATVSAGATRLLISITVAGSAGSTITAKIGRPKLHVVRN